MPWHELLLQSSAMTFRQMLPIILFVPSIPFFQQQSDILPLEAAKHLIKKVEPIYPSMAKQLHIQGDTVVQIAISETGSVKILKAISGSPVLMSSALDAIRQWQYSPFLAQGKPVAVRTQVTLSFSLGDSPEKIKQLAKINDLFFQAIDLCRKEEIDHQFAQAEATCENAIKLSEELDPARQMERMGAVRETGHVFFLQRKFSEALEKYQAELNIAEKILKPYEAELAAAHYHVANGLWGAGRTSEARTEYEKAESTYQAATAHIDSAFLKNEYGKKLKLVLRDHASLLRQIGEDSQADALDNQAANIIVKEGMHDE